MAVLEYDGMHLNGRTLKFALAMPGEMQQSKIRLLEEKKLEYERQIAEEEKKIYERVNPKR